MKIETMNVQEATDWLRAHGMSTSPETLRFGIQQGVFPFGIHIDRNGNPTYFVFRTQLERWAEERSGKNE